MFYDRSGCLHKAQMCCNYHKNDYVCLPTKYNKQVPTKLNVRDYTYIPLFQDDESSKVDGCNEQSNHDYKISVYIACAHSNPKNIQNAQNAKCKKCKEIEAMFYSRR